MIEENKNELFVYRKYISFIFFTSKTLRLSNKDKRSIFIFYIYELGGKVGWEKYVPWYKKMYRKFEYGIPLLPAIVRL